MVREMRRQIQMVCQDSYASLNPRLTIEDSTTFGLKTDDFSRVEASNRAQSMLRMAGLVPKCSRSDTHTSNPAASASAST